jgi:hypothetical protein
MAKTSGKGTLGGKWLCRDKLDMEFFGARMRTRPNFVAPGFSFPRHPFSHRLPDYPCFIRVLAILHI